MTSAARSGGRIAAALGLIALVVVAWRLLRETGADPSAAPGGVLIGRGDPPDAGAPRDGRPADGVEADGGAAPIVSRAFADREKPGGGSIKGRVVDAETDLPIAGARVAARSSATDEPEPDGVVTDARGEFALLGLPLCGGTITASADGYRLRQALVLLSARRATADLVLRLDACPRLTGRVVDEKGLPVSGAAIRQRPQSSGAAMVLSGADGSFAAPWQVEWGAGLFDFDHPDFAPAVSLVADETVVVLRRARRPWSGRVVDERGAPIAGATLIARSPEATDAVAPARREATLISATDGAFRWEEPAPGFLDVRIAAAGYLPRALASDGPDGANGHVVPHDPNAPVPPVDVVLTRGAAVKGLLVYDDGTPAARADVEVHSVGFGPGPTVASDADGRFETVLSAVRPLGASVQAPNEDRQMFERVEVGADGLIRLVVHRTRRLTGRVVDRADDTPIAGAYVVIWDGWMWGPGARARSDGTFEMRRPHRDVEFQTDAAGYLQDKHAFSAAAPDAPVVIRMTRASLISGTLLDESGRYDARLVVVSERIGGDGQRTETPPDATGYFEVTRVEPGRWRLTPGLTSVLQSGGAEWFVAGEAVEADLVVGGVAAVPLKAFGVGAIEFGERATAVLQGAGTITLSRADGGLLAMAARGAAADARSSEITSANAGATLLIPSGRYRLVAVSGDEGTTPVSREADVAPGRTVAVSFDE